MTVASSISPRPLEEELTALFVQEEDAIQDPYPLYARLLEEAPVHWYGSLLLVSRYRDVKEGYRDASRFLSTPTRRTPYDGALRLLSEDDFRVLEEVEDFEINYIRGKNGADHARVRQAAHRYFTRRGVADMEASFRMLFAELLDPHLDDEVFDFMDVAHRLPLLVITDMLGVPREDADQIKQWGDDINPQIQNPLRPEVVTLQLRTINEQSAYVADLIERHRKSTDRGPLVSAVLDAADGNRLTERELVAFFVHTLFAGHETTQHMIGNGIFALMRHRDQWRRLCADPSLAPSATEEIIRFDPPVPGSARIAAHDTEIGSVAVPEGTKVQLLSAAASRDPEAFRNPHAFDVRRSPNDHLGLGLGPHFCLGAALARLEGKVVFDTLARRFPDLELADGEETYRYRAGIRGLETLRVRLGRDAGETKGALQP